MSSMSATKNCSEIEFSTEEGVAVPAVTAAQMRELDRIAIEETGPNLYQMMENAGRSLALFGIERLGKTWRSSCILVLAGSGGNGGGGMCAARHLANRGIPVQLSLANTERLTGAPAFQRKLFHAAEGTEVKPSDLDQLRPDLILDSLVGYGLRSAPTGTVARLIEWANRSGAPVISLDVPSGLDATSGEAPGLVVKPAATVTLALPKTGLRPDTAGELFLADIGIPAGVYRRVVPEYVTPFRDTFWVQLQTRTR